MPLARIGRAKIGEGPKIVATIVSPQKMSNPAGVRQSGADIAELRLDFIAHWPEERITGLVKQASSRLDLPLIATVRASREGGAGNDGAAADEKRRLSLYKSVIPHVHAVDIELASPILAEVISAAHAKGRAVIVSYHHFQSTPSLTRLRALAQLSKAKGGDVVKIVTTARTPVDMMRLLSLLHEQPGRPLAAFAMGRYALLSRVMAYFFRSCLLYGRVDAERSGGQAAPGQPSVSELKQAIRQFALGKQGR